MYQALYRKYRPNSFSNVYGQDYVTTTLKNEIKTGQISHAYLFAGTRGTGKTTCARILAKAVNCENPQNGEPCGKCESCLGFEKGGTYDIVELDAASNNGVDDIRRLEDECSFVPARGKYRVFILDEVHMLSSAASNAFLKLLEEPPEHIIFILATTEPNKVLPTVRSRCQQFNFRRIEPRDIVARLKQVAGLEKIDLTDDAAVLIARVADGAMRDALSILDQCASTGGKIDSSRVSNVVGLADREYIYSLESAISQGSGSRALSIIDELYKQGSNMETLCGDLLSLYRNLMLVKSISDNRDLIVSTDAEYNEIVERAKSLSLAQIVANMDFLHETLPKIKASSNPRSEMEMALVRLCEPKLNTSLSSVVSRLNKLENLVKGGGAAFSKSEKESEPPEAEKASHQESAEDLRTSKEVSGDVLPHQFEPETEVSPEPAAEDSASEAEEPKPEPNQTFNPESSSTPGDEPVPFDAWNEFMDELEELDKPLHGVLAGSSAQTQGEKFYIITQNSAVGGFLKIQSHVRAVKTALRNITGHNYKLAVSKTEDSDGEKTDPLQSLIDKAEENNINIDFK